MMGHHWATIARLVNLFVGFAPFMKNNPAIEIENSFFIK
jgi:hypothetical protein